MSVLLLGSHTLLPFDKHKCSQVKNVWFDADHAWKDIDEILPTAAKPWDDQNDPAGQ
jgi:hypothetical protein